MKNMLYYGDNLGILRKYVEDNSNDLVYLDGRSQLRLQGIGEQK